ncbi:MAG: hypothetical protein KJ971_03875 [Firmicutes bacterium]|nr:hypothetical protein [Bacillota bacterium]
MKKLLTSLLAILLFSTMAGCDLLSTIIAVKDFSVEYREYSDKYNAAEMMTISTSTTLEIIDTDIESFEDMDTLMYFEIDKRNAFTYTEQTINDVKKISILEDTEDFTIEYILNEENNYVIPTILSDESETTVSSNEIFTLDESFSISDVQNELKTGEHAYEFDILLDKVIDLNNISGFVDQFKIFDSELSTFANAVAHVNLEFLGENGGIHVNAVLDSYQITFEDNTYVTLTLTNETTLTILDEYVGIDIYGDDYFITPVEDIRLAKKVYNADQLIKASITEFENGYVKLYLEPGIYDVFSDNFGLFSASQLYDADQNEVLLNAVDSIQYEIMTEGTYYYYLIPTTSFILDLTFAEVVIEPIE